MAAAAWGTRFSAPVDGLDPSWQAGLMMATERGMDFGTEVLFTYGPLGFLSFATATAPAGGQATSSAQARKAAAAATRVVAAVPMRPFDFSNPLGSQD